MHSQEQQTCMFLSNVKFKLDAPFCGLFFWTRCFTATKETQGTNRIRSADRMYDYSMSSSD